MKSITIRIADGIARLRESFHRWVFQATAVVATVVAVLVGVQLVPTANATLANGGFCIVANYGSDKFVGKAGAPGCHTIPEVDLDQYEQISAETRFLVERVDTAVSDASLANAPYSMTVTRHSGPDSEVVYTNAGTLNSHGYRNQNVVFSSERDEDDLPLYAPSYTIRWVLDGRVQEIEVLPEHFSKAGQGSFRQDWTSRTDFVDGSWVRVTE